MLALGFIFTTEIFKLGGFVTTHLSVFFVMTRPVSQKPVIVNTLTTFAKNSPSRNFCCQATDIRLRMGKFEKNNALGNSRSPNCEFKLRNFRRFGKRFLRRGGTANDIKMRKYTGWGVPEKWVALTPRE